MKHVNLILKQLRVEFPGIEIKFLRQSSHRIYRLNLRDGRSTTLSVATSPRDPDHCVPNSVADAKRRFAAIQLKENTCASTKSPVTPASPQSRK